MKEKEIQTLAGDLDGLHAGIAFDEGDLLGGGFSLILESADAKTGLEAERDFRLPVREILLDQLIGGERLTKLLSCHRVIPAIEISSSVVELRGREEKEKKETNRAAWKQNSAAPRAPHAIP